MISFQEIDQFRHAIRNVQHKAQFVGVDATGEPIMNRLAILPTLTYEGTVKIHGCCSSIQLLPNQVIPQSRNRVLAPDEDNYGFAKFIFALPDEAIALLKSLFGENVVIHGEWAGKGIQNTVAVNQVDRFWTIFRVEVIDESGRWLSLDGKDFSRLNEFRIFNIRQFGVETVDIDFEKPADATNKINELSLAVETECPVGKFFGISGIGEGRVWACVTPGWQSSKYVFKVKGQAHSKSKVSKLANVDVEKMKSIEDFVGKHLSEERLTQAYNWLGEQKKPQDEKSTGDFIKWLFNDIIKEESDELTASGLTVKELGGVVAKQARIWYFKKIGNA